MSAANKKSKQRSDSNSAQERLQAPWFVHVNVWTFMIVFGVSPVLCVLGTQGSMQLSEALGASAAVLLIQSLLWMAQRLCSSEDLSYWDGLLAASAAMTSGIALITLVLSFCTLLFTVVASCAFALAHDRRDPLRHASIRFRKLIIAIHQRRLYR